MRVKGHYSQVNAMYREMVASKRYPWYDCGTDNPYRYEGKKTYAYEIAVNMNFKSPTYVLQPAAGGMSIAKAWKGFNEFKNMGLMESIPKLVACQAEACGPIVDALDAGLDHVPGVEKGTTVATAIAVSNPLLLGNATLHAVQASGGLGMKVSDEYLLKIWKRLGKAGIFCEPSSAISVAAAYRMADEQKLKPEDVLVAVVTGIGFKDAATLSANVEIPQDIVDGKDAFYEKLDNIQAGRE